MSVSIVHVRSGFLVGGPEILILNGIAELPPERYRSTIVSFVLPGVENRFLASAKDRKITAVPVLIRHSFDLSAISSLADILADNQASLLVVHDYRALAIGLLARRRLPRRLPILAVAHGWTGVSSKVRFYEWLERKLFRLADAVVAVSAAKYEELRPLGLGDRLQLIENGVAIPTESEMTGASTLRTELGLADGVVLVGAVGRLSREKGHAVLLQAIATLVKDNAIHQPFHLVIVGDGPERAALKKLVENHHLENVVSLVGWKEEMRSVWRSLDLFVLPSFTEGLPMALLEGMAYRIAPIASAVGGCPAVIDSEACGLLVPPKDPLSLVQALKRLVNDPRARQSMAHHARERVIARYSLTRYACEFAALYDQLIRTKAA